MTQNEIYELARQAGFDVELMKSNAKRGNPSIAEIFAKLVAKKEREACAKICDEMGNTEANMNKTWRNGCNDSAKEIRARGQE